MTRLQLLQRLRETGASNETLCHVMHVWPEEPPPSQWETLFEQCAKAVGVHPNGAKTASRKTPFVRVRQLFSWYMQQQYKKQISLSDIGDFLGGRDHTTILHNRDEFQGLIDCEDELAMRDLSNLRRIQTGLEPIRPILHVRQSKPPKFIIAFYERKTDRYYRNAKSIRAFYGFPHFRRLDKMRFTRSVLPVDVLPEIEMIDI